MQINGKGRIDPRTLGGVTPSTTERDRAARHTGTPTSAPDRPKQDSVTFSDEARKLAGGASTREATSSERVAAVKQRVLLGAYNSAEMAGEVAKRILQRGEL
jgi:negative regulator of flagellin synthesis FlgM